MTVALEKAKAGAAYADARHEKIEDARFQRLLSDQDWFSLPLAVRVRFSAEPRIGASALYRGATTKLAMNRAGRVLAFLARAIGAPLPVDDHCDQCDAVVAVTDAPGGCGQVWTRLYARRDGFPQAIHSMKKFAGPTGLEEHVVDGRVFGLGMTLRLSVGAGALFFSSVDYFVRVLEWRMTLPASLAPGAMVIGHHDLGAGRFLFTLALRHKLFGLMIDQETVFEDMEARRD
ncbi:MAG: DUF4166 domain-containing protein [Parvularculaceae bacterium]